jgi:hypothetical protein
VGWASESLVMMVGEVGGVVKTVLEAQQPRFRDQAGLFNYALSHLSMCISVRGGIPTLICRVRAFKIARP